MKRLRKRRVGNTIFLSLIIIIFLGLSVDISAAQYNQEANALHNLGLLQGTNERYELDKEPRGVQGAVMLARLLGKEEEARNGEFIATSKNELSEIFHESMLSATVNKEFSIDIHGYIPTGKDFETDLYNVFKDTVSKFFILNEYPTMAHGYKGDSNKRFIRLETDLTIEQVKKNIEARKSLERKVKEVADTILRNDMSEYEKAITIHDYIVDHTVYDYENLINNTIPRTSYSAYGTFVLGRAVCQGYAEAFQLLGEAADIKTYLVTGEAYNGQWISHAWNIVQIDGNYYHVDATFDDPISADGRQTKSYTYFGLTDEQMKIDHIWKTDDYPSCESTEVNYYEKNGMVVEDGKQSGLTDVKDKGQ